MPPFAIQTENLTRTFGNVKAVDNITLNVPAGIVFGFLGPNGAGKTTTIRLLLGLLEPTKGRAQVLGYDTVRQDDEIREHCGALLEHNGLYERLTAEDNLEFYGRVWHMPASERQARIQELLTHMGLWDRRKELVRNWSRGMKQKLAVARTLLHRPSLVFLDEPTAGLDPVAAVALRDDLASLAEREGATIFLTTHNLAEAEKLCHEVGIIREGKLLSTGTLSDLRARSSQPKPEVHGRGFSEQVLAMLRAQPTVKGLHLQDGLLEIDLNQEVDTAPLVSAMVANGVQIEEVEKYKASLEDVFLALMEEEK